MDGWAVFCSQVGRKEGSQSLLLLWLICPAVYPFHLLETNRPRKPLDRIAQDIRDGPAIELKRN